MEAKAMQNRLTIRFDNRLFLRSHPRGPWGHGHWGFLDGENLDDENATWFWFTGTFSESLRAARKFYSGRAYESENVIIYTAP